MLDSLSAQDSIITEKKLVKVIKVNILDFIVILSCIGKNNINFFNIATKQRNSKGVEDKAFYSLPAAALTTTCVLVEQTSLCSFQSVFWHSLPQ